MFPAITQSQENLLNRIDNLSIFSADRFDLCVFVFDPNKQIVLVGGGPFEDSKYPQYEQQNKNILNFLGDFGYPYIGGGVFLQKGEWRYKQYIIGKTIDTLFVYEKICRVMPEKPSYVDDAAIGIILGMPKTACDGFGSDQELRTGQEFEEYNKYVRDNKIIHPFIPSVSHWREEIKYYQAVTEIIQLHAPKTYKELTEVII